MRKTILLLISFSFLSASNGDIKMKLDRIFKHYQKKYEIYDFDDLKNEMRKLNGNSNSSSLDRDPSVLIGNWEQTGMEMNLFVTVDTDQTAPTFGSLLGLEAADGAISLTNDEYDIELNYMMPADGGIISVGNSRNAGALAYAQHYVDSAASTHDQNAFELMDTFQLSYNLDSTVVTGGLGGDDPENCDINWPEDPYHLAIYSFVSEYVLSEGASVGCFLEDSELDQTYAFVAEELEEGWGGDGYDDDNSSDEFIFMNFDFFSFFAIMFGMNPGVEDPTLLFVDEDSIMVSILDFGGYDYDYEGSYVGAINDSNFNHDLENFQWDFNNITLSDYYGTDTLNVDGSIGAGTYELIAGEVTQIPMPAMFSDSMSTDGQEYLHMYEDGSGMIIKIEQDDYYYETMIDTSFFTWTASEDSLYMSDTFAVAYSFIGDTLRLESTNDPCDTLFYYYDDITYEDCFENSDLENFTLGLTGIQDFYEQIAMHYVSYDAVSIIEDNVVPANYELYPAYPNPFNPVTNIRFAIPEEGFVNLSIYDMAGRKIRTLVNEKMMPGKSNIKWFGINDQGQQVAAGVYLYSMKVGNFISMNKMVLLK